MEHISKGGFVLLGQSTPVGLSPHQYDFLGTVTITGDSSLNVVSNPDKHISLGKIILGGNSVVIPKVQADLETTWYVGTDTADNIIRGLGPIIDRSIDLAWDILAGGTITEPIVWWWRVESESALLPDVLVDGGDVTLNATNCVYVQYLTAINLSDLCTKLKEIYLARPLLCWRVRSIRKYNKPARRTLDASVYEDVNPWIIFTEQVGWETVPECMEFHLEAGQCAGPITITTGTYVPPTIFGHGAGYTYPIAPVTTVVPAVGPNVSAGATTDFSPTLMFQPTISLLSVPPDSEAALYEPEPIVWESADLPIATDCECVDIPQIVVMTHDFNKFYKLGYFLLRNNATLPISINLSYSAAQSRWMASTHFSGSGLEDGTTEKWLLKYEFFCTNAIENVDIADYTWQYSVLITRTQYWSNRSKKTTFRLLANFALSPGCNSHLDIRFTYYGNTGVMLNPITGQAAVNVILVDDIGLLDGTAWQNDPTLTVRLMGQQLISSVTKFDLSIFYPPDGQ